MYSVKVDENGYFTGSYGEIGGVDDGIMVTSLPDNPQNNKYYKLVKNEIGEYSWEFDQAKYDADKLQEYKNEVISKADMQCQSNIERGFYSSAIGEEHLYRFNRIEDQGNFTQQWSLLKEYPELYPEIPWKTEDAGVLVHTPDQWKHLLPDAAAHKSSEISKYWGIKYSVLQATSIHEINVILGLETDTPPETPTDTNNEGSAS